MRQPPIGPAAICPWLAAKRPTAKWATTIQGGPYGYITLPRLNIASHGFQDEFSKMVTFQDGSIPR